MKYSYFIILSLFLLCACGTDIMFSKKIEFENASWDYEQKAAFNFEISDTSTVYDIVLNIDHDREFTNQNFYVKFYTKAPDHNLIEDVVSMELANEFGQWNGKCGSKNCNVDILLQGKTKFRTTGQYSIEIEQFNRIQKLEGINCIELSLIKVVS